MSVTEHWLLPVYLTPGLLHMVSFSISYIIPGYIVFGTPVSHTQSKTNEDKIVKLKCLNVDSSSFYSMSSLCNIWTNYTRHFLSVLEFLEHQKLCPTLFSFAEMI